MESMHVDHFNALTENVDRRKSRSLPRPAVHILRKWLSDNCLYPYPNEEEKAVLMKSTGLTNTQICNWLINARRRILDKILLKKGLRPSLSGLTQKENKKTIPPVYPKLNIKVDQTPPPPPLPPPLTPTNIIAAMPVSYTVFPPLAMLSRYGHDLLQSMAEGGAPFRFTFQPVQRHPAEDVSPPFVLAATQKTELEECPPPVLAATQKTELEECPPPLLAATQKTDLRECDPPLLAAAQETELEECPPSVLDATQEMELEECPPPVLAAARESELEEQINRLHILAEMACQRKEEMEAEAAKMRAAFTQIINPRSLDLLPVPNPYNCSNALMRNGGFFSH
ncbi:homeobox protein TGIF1-like [Pelobates fuscus]|uniref:homeobox protein TGIF1-like n=1 Tax=Pelobates fuscus TaxID=191477 RepID=UPI002FE48DD9